MSAVLSDVVPISQPVPTRRRTAWIVISESAQAQSIAQAMRDHGWQIDHIADDLHSIHRLITGLDALPDVLITGLRFADGDGFQLIRQLAKRPHPPALFIASHQQRAVIKAALALAEACRIEVAGSAEQPIEARAIGQSLATFEPGRMGRAQQIARPPLERDDLLSLLDRGALYPWMQPKLRLSSQEVVGFEALMRAHDNAGALILPDRLISALACHGLLDEATMRMARQTVDFVATALSEGMAISASINVSMQSLSNFAFCRELALIVERAQLDPSWITIEITETDAMADMLSVIENAARIRMLGFNLAIDDFGTAYSSLFQLSRIPFSELKIERAFISGVDEDSGKQAIVRACSQLGTSLGLHVVAEGVETAEELDFVRQAGCSHIQGYLVARPMPAARALDWLRGFNELRFDLPN